MTLEIPQEIQTRVLAGDADAEGELLSILRKHFEKEYSRYLGPLAEDYLHDLYISVFERIRRNEVQHPDSIVPFCYWQAKSIRLHAIRDAARASRKLVPITDAHHRRDAHELGRRHADRG